MRRAASSLGFLCCALLARPAAAQVRAAAPLSVERGAGAETCPGADELSARVARIRGAAPSGATAYAVHFVREAGSLSATIQIAGDAASARVLRDDGDDCAALTQATAVTLSLLIDASPEPAATTPPAAVTPPRPTPQPAPPARPAIETSAALALGGHVLFGVVAPAAPALSAELGIRAGAFRASAGAFWLAPRAHALGPGNVDERLAGGVARLCLTALESGSLRFGACSGAWLGRRVAEGRGFSESFTSATTYLGVPLEVSLSHGSAPVGWELGAGALLSFPRRTYYVSGLGNAYESAPIGALVSLRGLLIWPF